jgi:hypothetical protein
VGFLGRRGGPNKLFPKKNVLSLKWPRKKKKGKTKYFLAHIKNPSQMF